MTELALFVFTVLLTGCLLRPLLRKVPLPAWLVRAQGRGRPGVPVTAWLGAGAIMGLSWLIGEQRGLLGLLLLLTWIIAPLLAGWISVFWIRRERRA
jgi:hypothetical protein